MMVPICRKHLVDDQGEDRLGLFRVLKARNAVAAEEGQLLRENLVKDFPRKVDGTFR